MPGNSLADATSRRAREHSDAAVPDSTESSTSCRPGSRRRRRHAPWRGCPHTPALTCLILLLLLVLILLLVMTGRTR